MAHDVDRLPLYKSALELHETSGIPYRLDQELMDMATIRFLIALYKRPDSKQERLGKQVRLDI